MKMMFAIRALSVFVIFLAVAFLLLISGYIGSINDDLSRKVHSLGKPYDSSIYTLYDNKIYASVPNNGEYQVLQADIATFNTFSDVRGYRSRKVAFDKNNVYAGNRIVPNLDPAKTTSIGQGYYSDGQYTYYLGNHSVRNDDLSIMAKVLQSLLYGFNIGEKPQTYIYPIQELPLSNEPYYPILKNSVVTDGQAVFFEGKRLPKADPATLRQIGQVYEESYKRPSDDYFADHQHVYYKSTLLPLGSNTDIYNFKPRNNITESYLLDPRTGKVFMEDIAFDEKHQPYQLVTPYAGDLLHVLFSSKDGIYYYEPEDKEVKRAGDNPFYDSQFEALSEFVFTDGKSTLFLESSEYLSGRSQRGQNNRTRNKKTNIKQIDGIDAALWEKIGTGKRRFASVWENAGQYYYFDNLGSGQLIRNSIYTINNQHTVQRLLNNKLRHGEIREMFNDNHLHPVEAKAIITAHSKYRWNDNLVWLILAPFAIFPVAAWLQKKYKVLQEPFIIKDGKLHMLTLFPKSFSLSEIQQVTFTQHYQFPSGHSGKMQILLKNGHFSRHYRFSKTVTKDGELETIDFIISLQKILRSHGIIVHFKDYKL